MHLFSLGACYKSNSTIKITIYHPINTLIDFFRGEKTPTALQFHEKHFAQIGYNHTSFKKGKSRQKQRRTHTTHTKKPSSRASHNRWRRAEVLCERVVAKKPAQKKAMKMGKDISYRFPVEVKGITSGKCKVGGESMRDSCSWRMATQIDVILSCRPIRGAWDSMF